MKDLQVKYRCTRYIDCDGKQDTRMYRILFGKFYTKGIYKNKGRVERALIKLYFLRLLKKVLRTLKLLRQGNFQLIRKINVLL